MNLLQQVMVHILTREPLCISLMDWDDKAMAEAVNQTALRALAQIQALVHQRSFPTRSGSCRSTKPLSALESTPQHITSGMDF